MRASVLIGLFLLLLSACGDGKSEGSGTTNSGDPDVVQLSDNQIDAAAMLAAVNQARASGVQCGDTWHPPVEPLVWSGTLERAALIYSTDMHENGAWSHVGSDGDSMTDRLDQVGYEYRAAGENIAKGQRSIDQVMDAWLNSPGHCRNIMRSSFTELGAARVANSWTQNFGAPRASSAAAPSGDG